MRTAAVPGFRLCNSSLSNKVLITLALIAITLGLIASIATTLLKTGLAPESVANYYLGSAIEGVSGDFMFAEEPRPLAELAEVTHLHLMGGSLLLFLLCHLLALCALSERIRIFIYIGTFVSFILTFGSPWLIVYVARSLSVLYSGSVLLLILFLLVACLLINREIWFVKQ